MSFFDDLPPVGSVVNPTSTFGEYCVHAWLFNAGVGTTVKDLVTGSDATLVGGYTWLTKGITFATAHLDIPLSGIDSDGATVVMGVHTTALAAGWNLLLVFSNLASDFGWYTSYVDLRWGGGLGAYNAGIWVDGVSTTTPASGYHIISAKSTYDSLFYSYPVIVGASVLPSESFKGDLAFVYVFAGEPDTQALLDAIQINPYAMFVAVERAIPHEITIAGKTQVVQGQWLIRATANGRSIMSGNVVSLDASYRPGLDDEVVVYESATIVSSSVAAASVITTLTPHGLVNGMTVEIGGHAGSSPMLDGWHIATVVTPTTFSIPVNVTTGGTGGSASRRIFAGTVLQPTESGLGGYGVIPITTRIDCADYNSLADRRYVSGTLAAGTLKSMLETLATLCDFTLAADQPTGPTLADDLVADYMLLRTVLDQLASLTGYGWAWDDYNQCRMVDASTVAAPVDVLDAETVAIGDITVAPSRANYANRVILRYSSTATAAWGFLFSDGSTNVADLDTATVGGKTYTWRSTLGVLENSVQLGGDIEESLQNLAKAIMQTGTPGTEYTAATTLNLQVSAYVFEASGGPAMKATALTPGSGGNGIGVGSTSSGTVQAVWGWEGWAWGGTPITALFGGSDQAMTLSVIAEDTGEQATHGIWEIIIESPETTDPALAASLAAAYLAERLVIAKVVRYETEAVGLRPGQTQTITIAGRNLDGAYLITEVNHRHVAAHLLRRTVTAVENANVQSVKRWRDTYKQWAGLWP